MPSNSKSTPQPKQPPPAPAHYKDLNRVHSIAKDKSTAVSSQGATSSTTTESGARSKETTEKKDMFLGPPVNMFKKK